MRPTFSCLYLGLSVFFLRTWLDRRSSASRTTKKTAMLGLVVVICHRPCAGERKTMAGKVDHGFLCSIGDRKRT